MATTEDTEITLGTGRMLGLFLVLVLVCAVFFSIGFSLGRKTASGAGIALIAPATPATVVRPTAGMSASQPAQTPSSDQFSFYKAVEQKSADSQLTPQSNPQAPGATSEPPKPQSTEPAATAGAYYVQVAAVTREEDANALVEALKKKQYSAFSANSASADKLFHVQVGPFAEVKDAEATRNRLVSDGYNPILKK